LSASGEAGECGHERTARMSVPRYAAERPGARTRDLARACCLRPSLDVDSRTETQPSAKLHARVQPRRAAWARQPVSRCRRRPEHGIHVTGGIDPAPLTPGLRLSASSPADRLLGG
jgi:hypothetical protein